MQDTLFHKGDKVYMTEGPMKFLDAEVTTVNYSATGDGSVYYTLLVSEEQGRGKNKKTVYTSVAGITSRILRKL